MIEGFRQSIDDAMKIATVADDHSRESYVGTDPIPRVVDRVLIDRWRKDCE